MNNTNNNNNNNNSTSGGFFSPREVNLIKEKYGKELSPTVLDLFLYRCEKAQLNPLEEKVYAREYDGELIFIIRIDGFREIATRTGQYFGSDVIVERDSNRAVISATAVVTKFSIDGRKGDFKAIAFIEEFFVNNRVWRKIPATMLSKCAEAAALRKAFPSLASIYIEEEFAEEEEPKTAKGSRETKEFKETVEPTSSIVAGTPTIEEGDLSRINTFLNEVNDPNYTKNVLAQFKVANFSQLKVEQMPLLTKAFKAKRDQLNRAKAQGAF